MSRRIIESSDDEDPSSSSSASLGPFAAHLSPKADGGYALTSQPLAFIESIPANPPPHHQMIAVISACRTLVKKDKVKLFKNRKAEVVLSTWWTYCLSNLSSNGSTGEVVKVLIELLKLSKELNEVLKTKTDLGKAAERMGVDLVKMLTETKGAVVGSEGMDEVKAQLMLVERHFRDVYGVEIGTAPAPPQASPAKASTGNNVASSASAAAASTPQETDRKTAAAQKRLEALQNKHKRAAGVASPVKPAAQPPLNMGAPSNDMGRRDSDNGFGRRDSGQGGRGSSAGYDRPPSASSGNDKPPAAAGTAAAAAAANRPPVAAAASKIQWDDGNLEGWGRRSPIDPNPHMSELQKAYLHRDRTDTRQWGTPLNGREIPPYPGSSRDEGHRAPSNVEPPRDRDQNDHRGGYDRQPSNYAPRDDRGGRDQGHRDDSHQSSNYRRDDSREQYSMNRSRDQGPGDYRDTRPSYDSQSNRQSYDSSRADHQPYPNNRNGSSDNQPYSRGDIRNNQPVVGGTGYRNDDQYASRRDDYRSNEQPNYAPRGDDANLSRRSSQDYDRTDSRASSYQSRSSDRQYEDRRDYDDRRRSDSRPPNRSDSPPRDNRGPPSRRYDDDRRSDGDRFDDRKRRDRDEPSRGGGGGASQRLCKYFFTPRGCRNGAGCRFSHEDGGDRKPAADRSNDRRSNFEDGGSEDGELRPAKRFRGPDGSSMQSRTNNAPPASAGRGLGRGAHINKPAWMTQAENGSGPVGAASLAGTAPVPVASNQPTPAPLNNADLASLLSSVNATSATVPPAAAGRGRGRGKVDNRPAWMTAAENSQPGPTGVAPMAAPSPAPANGMNGRFAPPPAAQLSDGPPRAMGRGRGRGRGVDNKPSWMSQDEWDRRNG